MARPPAAPPAPAASKRKRGRPKYLPTDKDRAYVRSMASVGIKQADICIVLGISDVTLRRHYKSELATAAIIANAAVSGSLLQNATKGRNVIAQIWWEKTRQGRSDKLTVSGDANNPVVTRVVYGWSDDPSLPPEKA